MANPVVFLPLLTTNLVGWAVLGAAGYLTYKLGKKSGLKSDDQLEKECLIDRAVKGTMKTVYKARIKADESLSSAKDKYSSMWDEAQDEATGKS
jgi:ribosomal protein S20